MKRHQQNNNLDELIKLHKQINDLVQLTKQHQQNIIDNCKLNGKIANESVKTNNRSFNLNDFYYLLSRSFKSSIIREWKMQLLKVFVLLFGVLMAITIYPNDIGSDPSCPIDVLNEFNMSEITIQIYDSINGKRTNGEMNVMYLIVLFFYFGGVYILFVTLVFANEVKVSLF